MAVAVPCPDGETRWRCIPRKWKIIIFLTVGIIALMCIALYGLIFLRRHRWEPEMRRRIGEMEEEAIARVRREKNLSIDVRECTMTQDPVDRGTPLVIANEVEDNAITTHESSGQAILKDDARTLHPSILTYHDPGTSVKEPSITRVYGGEGVVNVT